MTFRLMLVPLLALWLAAGAGPASAGSSSGWTLVQNVGDVVISAGLFQTVSLPNDATLPEGAIVTTGKSGRAVLRRGGEHIIVQPGTRLKLEVAEPGATRVTQASGSALYEITKKSTPHFQVDTPWLAAVVKGTAFSIDVEDGTSALRVTEGTVEVSNPARTAVTLVSAGAEARIDDTTPGAIQLLDAQGLPSTITTVHMVWDEKTLAHARGGHIELDLRQTDEVGAGGMQQLALSAPTADLVAPGSVAGTVTAPVSKQSASFLSTPAGRLSEQEWSLRKSKSVKEGEKREPLNVTLLMGIALIGCIAYAHISTRRDRQSK